MGRNYIGHDCIGRNYAGDNHIYHNYIYDAIITTRQVMDCGDVKKARTI